MKKILKIDETAACRLNKRTRLRDGVLKTVGILMLVGMSLLSVGVISADGGDNVSKTMAAGMIGVPLAFAGGIREEAGNGPDGGSGDGGSDDPVLRSLNKIESSIDETQKKMRELEQKAGENSELKGELEALQKAVEGFEGLDHDLKAFALANKNLEQKLGNLRREVAGDPKSRIVRDEEKRSILTASARIAYMREKGLAIPQELKECAARAANLGNTRAVTGASTPGSSYIDDELENEVYQLVASYGKWSTFDVASCGARSVKIPIDTSDPDVLWHAEGSTPTEEAYTGTQVTLTIKKALGWISVTNEMLEDDEIGLASHLLTKFARDNARRLDHACFVADGTDDTTHGEFNGIFDAGTAYGAATGNVSIATLDFDDFIGLTAGADEALPELPTTNWWMHPQVLVQLLKIKDSNGRPIFLTALEAPAAGGIGSILGYPVITANMAPKVDGVSKAIAAFGDSQALAVRVRRDFEFATSTEAKFLEDKTVFRSRMRAGVKIKDATGFEILTTAAS